MTIEITGTTLIKGVVEIVAIDISEENLHRLERMRDDTIEKEVRYIFDTKVSKEFEALQRWLHRQSATRQSRTYGEALMAIIGTITESYGIGIYRVWE